MALPRWITKPAGVVAQQVGGAYDYLSPGSGKSTLTNAGDAIVDPNRVYAGALNPFGGSGGTSDIHNGGTSGFVQVNGGTTPAPGPDSNTSTTSTGGQQPASNGDGGAASGGASADTGAIRSDITNLVNHIKDIFNARYGQVDQAGAEQAGILQSRYANDAQELSDQVGHAQEAVGAQAAAAGTYDSSYRGNQNDQVTQAGESQARSLGDELQNNLGTIGSAVARERAAAEAGKGGVDALVSHLADVTNVNDLMTLRNTLESRIAELNANGADNNTTAQNISTVQGLTPSGTQGAELRTTLSRIAGGNAPMAQKMAIGDRLLSASGLSPQERRVLAMAFHSQLGVDPNQDPNQQQA